MIQYKDFFRPWIRSAISGASVTFVISSSLFFSLYYWSLPYDSLLGFIAVGAGYFFFVFILKLLSKPDCGIEVYLDKQIEGESTLFQGKAIAMKIAELDGFCGEKGFPLLSSFGFNDDLQGDKIVWHNPEEGLTLLQHLLLKIEVIEEDVEEWSKVTKDLKRWEKRLTEAKETKAKFSLLVRVSKGVCGMEFDQREGYF